MRLEKFLSESGIASRRDAKKYISAGRVSVNGERVLIPGTHIAPQQDEITLDGEPIRGKPRQIYLMLNKPAGYVTTVRDERKDGRQSWRWCGTYPNASIRSAG